VGLFVISLVIPFPLQVGITLLTGWVGFLARTLPKVTVNWSGIGMGVLCSAILVGALHTFCKWFARARHGGEWKWASTLAIFGLTGALFVATMGITGVVHQIAWLAASDEKWTRRRGEDYLSLRQYSFMVENALEQNNWNTEYGQRNYLGEIGAHPRYSPEIFQVVYFPGEAAVTNAVIFHRDPAIRERVGFCTVNRAEGNVQRPWNEITQYVPLMARGGVGRGGKP
jgi:hypothetical protein